MSQAFVPDKVYWITVTLEEDGEGFIFDYPGETTDRLGRLPVKNRLEIGSGFSEDWEPKPLIIDNPRSSSGHSRHVFRLSFFWLVTAAMKADLERVDAAAFDFKIAPLEQDIGIEIYFADVVRYVDALSRLNKNKSGEPVLGRGLQFDAQLLRGVGFFRVPIYFMATLCTGDALNRLGAECIAGLDIEEVGFLG